MLRQAIRQHHGVLARQPGHQTRRRFRVSTFVSYSSREIRTTRKSGLLVFFFIDTDGGVGGSGGGGSGLGGVRNSWLPFPFDR